MNTDLLQLVDVLALGGDLSNLSVTKAIAIGDAMLDYYLNGVRSPRSLQASVPVFTINDQKQIPGGAANIAINIHNLGADVTFLSVVGDDWEGALLRQKLESHGISTKYVFTQAGRRTFVKQQVMAGSPLVVIEQGSTDAIDSKTEQALIAQLNSSFADCDAVIVSDYGYGTMTAKVIQAIAQLQSKQPRVLVVDSNRPNVYYHLDLTAFNLNYDDAVRLLGVSDDIKANQIANYQQQLLELTKAPITIVSLNEHEAIAFQRVQNLPSHQTSNETISQLRVTVAGSTLISALIALAGEQGGKSKSKIKNSSCTAAEKYLPELRDAVAFVTSCRACGLRIVFTNGCFDILHAGHISYLNQAKALGDILIIGVNSDDSVSRLKGPTRPINTLLDRIQVLAALGCVDRLIAFDQDNPIHLIQLLRPDVYVKGGDYTKETLPEAVLVEQLGGVVEILPFVENRSTTSIIERIFRLSVKN